MTCHARGSSSKYLVIEDFWPTRQLVSSPADVSSMRALRTNALRFILASLAGLCGIASPGANTALAADEARPPVAIQFSLDRPIDAAAAPFVMAATGGLFSAEGLAVTINIASGSPDAIARVAAGTSDFALVDINALVRFRDKDKQGVAAGQGGVRAVQQGALRHHRPQEPRHPRAVGYRGQESRRRRGRSFDPAVAGGGEAERHQDSRASSRAASAPRCASRCCRRARSTPSPDFPICRRSI